MSTKLLLINSVKKFQSSDNAGSYALGRRAFQKSISLCDEGKGITNKDSKCNTSKYKYINNSKSTENISNDLRIQRLRLQAIGRGSRVVSNNEHVNIEKNVTNNKNTVNSALARVRGAGYLAPTKSNLTWCC